MLSDLPFALLLRIEALARREIGLPWLRGPL
jgi:hypothetical protein